MRNDQIEFSIGDCSLGKVLVAKSPEGICAILLGDDDDEVRHDLKRSFPTAQPGTVPELPRVIEMVERPGEFDLPLDARGTAFQRRVWQALREIPVGATASYADIAERIGFPQSVRAVAAACAANPVAVVVPCHRVIHKDGSLSGYGWGVQRKQALLERERISE